MFYFVRLFFSSFLGLYMTRKLWKVNVSSLFACKLLVCKQLQEHLGMAKRLDLAMCPIEEDSLNSGQWSGQVLSYQGSILLGLRLRPCQKALTRPLAQLLIIIFQKNKNTTHSHYSIILFQSITLLHVTRVTHNTDALQFIFSKY